MFHRLARKYRTQPELLKEEYEAWQTELEQLHQLEDPETLAEQVEVSYQEFLSKAQHLTRFAVMQPNRWRKTDRTGETACPA